MLNYPQSIRMPRASCMWQILDLQGVRAALGIACRDGNECRRQPEADEEEFPVP
jgi:hypothetical protein